MVPAGEKFILNVTYKPAYGGSFYQVGGLPSGIPQDGDNDYDESQTFLQFNPQDLSMKIRFEILTKSIISTSFNVKCNGVPVDMQLSHTKVDFGCVHCGTSVSKAIYIKNNSKFDCPYEFTCEGLMDSGDQIKAVVNPLQVQAVELQDVTRPLHRALGKYPIRLTPSSGVAVSQINTTINVVFNLIPFTSVSTDLVVNQANDSKSYIPP